MFEGISSVLTLTSNEPLSNTKCFDCPVIVLYVMSPAFHPLDTTLVIDILGLGGVTGGGGTISGRGTNTGSGTTSSSETVRSVSAGLSINSGRNLDCISAKLITTLALPVEPPKNEEIVSGLIFDPIKNEMFYAEKDNGAFFNNHRIKVSKKMS